MTATPHDHAAVTLCGLLTIEGQRAWHSRAENWTRNQSRSSNAIRGQHSGSHDIAAFGLCEPRWRSMDEEATTGVSLTRFEYFGGGVRATPDASAYDPGVASGVARFGPPNAAAPALATAWSSSTVEPETPMPPMMVPSLASNGTPPGKVMSPPLETSIW